MKQDKHMDEWMRDHLEDHGSILPEGGWEGLQDLHKKKKRKPAIFWWLSGFGAAAALFLAAWLIWTPGSDAIQPMADQDSPTEKPSEKQRTAPAVDQKVQGPEGLIPEQVENRKQAILPVLPAKENLKKAFDDKGIDEPESKESSRYTEQVTPPLKALALPLNEPIFEPRASLALKSSDPVLPPSKSWNISWTAYTSYGTGILRANRRNDLGKASAPQYDDIIKNSTFRLHRLGLGLDAGWKKGPWAWSAGMQIERSWVASQIADVDVEGIGNAQNPDSNAVSNQDIAREVQANPARFWTVGVPLGVRYYPLNRAIYLTAGINPEVNFGASGSWILDKSSQGVSLMKSAETSLGIPRFSWGGSLGIGWDINQNIAVQYQVKAWANDLLYVEPFSYRSALHQIQLRITIPG